jgi:predicted RND superfamily exporter protein
MAIAPGASIHWIGAGDYQWYILEGFKFSKFVNIAMIAFMLLGLRFFFGTWRAGFIYCGTLFISAIWVIGLKGFVGSSFDVLSTGLFLLLAISSLEDFTFACHDQIQSKDWRKSILKIAVPAFYTSLSTILGFWALRTSEVQAIGRMGSWAAWGAFVEWLLLFIFIPALLQQFPTIRVWGNPKKSIGTNFLNRYIFKAFPKKISLIALIIYPLAFIFYSNLNYNEAPQNIFPKDQEYSKSMKFLFNSKGWLGNASLLFEENLPPDQMENIVAQILKTPEAKNLVVKHESPWEIQRWISKNGNLDQMESESYFNISKASEQLVDEQKHVRVLFYLKETAVESVAALKKKVADICQNRCHLGGEVVAYSDFTSLIPKTLISSLFSSLIQVSLVICFIAVAQNKEKYIPSLLLSAYWGPFFIIMMLGSFHTTLDFWKSIFASILIGLAGDNAIQFLFGSEKKNIRAGIKDRGPASIVTALLMAFAALIYLGSYFSSPREFGVILSVGLLASLFGELWLFQGLMDIKISRRK